MNVARIRYQGFTLIETLLVLTIISVILAMVGIQFTSGPSRGPQQRFEAFSQQLAFAQQYSYATQTVLALAEHEQQLRWIQLSLSAQGEQQSRIHPDPRLNPVPIHSGDSISGDQEPRTLEIDQQRWQVKTVLTPQATNQGALFWQSGDFRAQLQLSKLTILGWAEGATVRP